MRFLLFPIALLYHIVLTIRHKLYDWHILKTTQFEKPVICVGNLNLGGTGKTPHIEYLIELLKDQYSIATLSRGYGRKTKGFKLAEGSCTYEDLGDEPLQYYKKHPEILVAVDADRVNGVRKLLLRKESPEVILLDDAFQHRSINAGLNLLMTEYENLYANDFLFPAGTLRDVKSAAKRAQIIVVSKSPKELDEEGKKRVIRRIKAAEGQHVYFSYLEYDPLLPLNETAKTINAENADSVLAFCGIAKPKPFVEVLKKRYKNVDFLCFADHHAYSSNDLKEILKHYENLGGEKKIIVTTEKDAARLTNSPYLCQFEHTPLYDLPISVRFHEEEKFNEAIMNYVRQDHQHC